MSSVGSYLRELRERRGVSLEEIARTTRVGRSYLEALEAGEFGKLPAPVFTRGFVLAYCQALGVSADEALARYGGKTTAADDTAGHPARALPQPASAARDRAARARGPVLVSFVLLIVLGIALFAVALVLQSGREGDERRAEAMRAGKRDTTRLAPRPEPVPVEPATPANPGLAGTTVDASAAKPGIPSAPSGPPPSSMPGTMTPSSPAPGTLAPRDAAAARSIAPVAPVTSSGAPPNPASVATLTQQDVSTTLGAVSAPYRLVARTTASTWIRVRTDDGKQTDETVAAGQVREWVSNRPFTISVGNAGGVRLELNGRALPPLGPAGAVIGRLVLPGEAP